MCYYNGQKVSRAEFIRLMEIGKRAENYDFLNVKLHNGFSYGKIAVLKPNETRDDFDIVQMEWGLIPKGLPNREEAQKFRYQYTTLNAKAENLFKNEKGRKSIYAEAAQQRRCLILSTGFFEWRHIFPVSEKTGKPLKTAVKYPYYISVKNEEYFYMAGIWEPWTDRSTGEYVETVALTTTKANGLMEVIHNSKMRMPTILNDELAWQWMMGDLSEERVTQIALTQYPSLAMQACPISKDFRSELEPTEPYQYPENELPAFETSFSV